MLVSVIFVYLVTRVSFIFFKFILLEFHLKDVADIQKNLRISAYKMEWGMHDSRQKMMKVLLFLTFNKC